MTYMLDGLRAATLCALILTIWSFFGVEAALENATDRSGLLYVATTFGILGLPCLLLGFGVGSLLDAWNSAIKSPKINAWLDSAFELVPKNKGTMLAAVVVALTSGIALAGTHIAITSKFQRASFQVIFLGLVLIIALVGQFAITPLILGKVIPVNTQNTTLPEDESIQSRLSTLLLLTPIKAAISGVVFIVVFSKLTTPPQDAKNFATQAALAGAALSLIPLFAKFADKPISRLLHAKLGGEASLKKSLFIMLGAAGLVSIAGYVYAASLGVWSSTTLLMSVVMIIGPLTLIAAMGKLKWDRLAWTIGLPIAGLLSAFICFFGAWSWASANAEMRRAVTQESALLATFTGKLQRFGDADKDGHAGSLGGADCDDSNPSIYPGARDIPANNIDEDCDGKDADIPSLDNHPAKRALAAAVKSAQRELRKLENQAPPEPPKNVIMILVDTLRYDHMGFAGYERNTSPNIDKLASESIVFEDTYATAPHTPRSIPCLFFGKYPSHMNWRGGQYNYPKVRPENLGVFEVLQEKGWKNYGFSSHFYFEEKRGMSQGFEMWDNEGAGTIAESNTDIAAPRIYKKLVPKLEELAKNSKTPDAQPFSMFIHLFEPHGKWIGHKEHDFGKADSPVQRHINNYDSEIAYVDTYIAKIIEKTKELGIYDDTIIILTSDHGEAFNEHKVLFHGTNLYNEVIKVPLIIRIPGWKPRRVKGPISLIDVAPTLLDLFEFTIPTDFEGISLRDAMLGEEEVPLHPVYSELLPYTNWKEHHKSLIYGDKKLIKVFTSGTSEMFDLKQDPAEQKNIAREDKESFDKLNTMLSDWINSSKQ